MPPTAPNHPPNFLSLAMVFNEVLTLLCYTWLALTFTFFATAAVLVRKWRKEWRLIVGQMESRSLEGGGDEWLASMKDEYVKRRGEGQEEWATRMESEFVRKRAEEWLVWGLGLVGLEFVDERGE